MKKVDLDVLTKTWKTVQIYGPEDEDELFEVRLPKFDKTETLMHGFGPTINKAALDAVENIKQAQEEPLPDGLVVKPKSENEKAGEELLVGKSNGSGKSHVFRPGENVSLCGKVDLSFDAAPVSRSDVKLDEVCQNCAKKAPEEALKLD